MLRQQVMTASAAASSMSRMHSAIANLRARFSSTFNTTDGGSTGGEKEEGAAAVTAAAAGDVTATASMRNTNSSSFNHENSHTHRKLICSNQSSPQIGQHPGPLKSVPLKFTQNILSRELSTDSVLSTCSTTDLNFRICGVSDYNQVIDFLYPNFHRDEPMSKCLDLVGPEMDRNEVLDEFALHGLKDNLSIAAFEASTGKLVGICINHTERPGDNEEESPNPKFEHIMEVLRRVNERGGDLFRQLNTDTLFTIKMVSTDKVNRKAGLGTELLKRSMDLSKTLGFKGIKTEATGLYSRKAFIKLGFEVKAEYKYKDYVVDGQVVFDKMEEPHRMITLMTKSNA